MAQRSRLSKKIAATQRRAQQFRASLEAAYVRMQGGFDDTTLIDTLRGLGINPGDAVMVHIGFTPHHGYDGDVQSLLEALKAAVGNQGTLIMLTIPFKGMSAHAWLSKGKPFNVKRSVSKVGIVTELFRRSEGVLRSLHPTHPVAAWGAQAERFTQTMTTPELFGPESPFGTLVEVGGKVLLYDVPFKRMTFEHYLEDHVQEHLSVPVYRDELVDAKVVNHEGETHTMPVYPITDEINQVRQTPKLEKALRQAGILKSTRLSLTQLMVADAQAMVKEVDKRVATGWRFHRA